MGLFGRKKSSKKKYRDSYDDRPRSAVNQVYTQWGANDDSSGSSAVQKFSAPADKTNENFKAPGSMTWALVPNPDKTTSIGKALEAGQSWQIVPTPEMLQYCLPRLPKRPRPRRTIVETIDISEGSSPMRCSGCGYCAWGRICGGWECQKCFWPVWDGCTYHY